MRPLPSRFSDWAWRAWPWASMQSIQETSRMGMIRVTQGLKSNALLFSAFLWHSTPLGLPQVVVDGQGIHADWHSLGRDDGELLSVWAVLVQLINHLLADALGSCSRQLLYLFGVGEVRVERPELAATVTKQDHQVVGLALVQLLVGNEVKQG